MRVDVANPRAHRNRDLDHVVQRRLIAGSAECAIVLLLVQALKCRAGIEDAAAAWTEYVPGQLEDSDAGRM